MDAQRVRERVIQAIAQQLSKDPVHIRDEQTLQELGADSVDRVELVMQLEDALDIEIDDNDAEKLKTVGDIVTYCQGKSDR